MTTRSAAVAAATDGWAVFPCRERDKRPAVPDHPEHACKRTGKCAPSHLGWEQLACDDPALVGRHWPSAHNIGGACRRNHVVFDLDSHHHGELPTEWAEIPGVTDGRDVLAQLCEWAGQDWPHTRMHRTPLDGWHLVFTAPPDRLIRNSSGKIGPLIDVRGSGGYIVLPGSIVDERAYPDDLAAQEIVRAGKPYELADDTPPVPLPGWLADLADPVPAPRRECPEPQSHHAAAGSRLSGIVKVVLESQPGDRTGPLVWAAYRVKEMAEAGQSDPAADGELLIQAAVRAGIRGGESYARQQVRNVLGGER